VWVVDGPGSLPLGSTASFVTPAGRQAGVLNDMLRTESFRAAAARGAGLIPADDPSFTDDGGGLSAPTPIVAAAAKLVGTSTRVRAQGQHVLRVSVVTTWPEVSQAIARSVIDEYSTQTADASAAQAENAIAYYNIQLPLAEQELERRISLMDEYVASNPGVDELGSGDIQFQSLLADVNDQDRVTRKLEQALQNWHLTAAASEQGQSASFGVQDPPNLPTAPLQEGTIATYGPLVVSIALGAFVSLSLVYIKYRADHSVRSAEDLAALGLPVLGRVPTLTSNRNKPWYRQLVPRRERDFTRTLAATLSVRGK
jgi:uncharacterized protein involved in exopolysaccharide biosynthesis